MYRLGDVFCSRPVSDCLPDVVRLPWPLIGPVVCVRRYTLSGYRKSSTAERCKALAATQLSEQLALRCCPKIEPSDMTAYPGPQLFASVKSHSTTQPPPGSTSTAILNFIVFCSYLSLS